MAPKSAMDELTKKKTALTSKLSRAQADAEALANAPLDLHAIKIEMDLLENLGIEVQTLEDNVLVTCSESDFNAQQEEMTILLNQYKKIKLDLLKLMSLANTPAQLPAVPGLTNQPQIPQPTQVKLPKLELPRFSGGLLEWVSFRDRFKAAVHDKDMPGSLKLQYLKAQLDGKAAAFLDGVATTDDGYEDSWKALVERFQNKRELARAHLDRLLHQATALNSSSESLRSVVDTTRECLRTLKTLGLPTEHWEFFVCHMVSQKLNADTKLQWERTFQDDSFPSLNDFLNFLDREARSFAAAGSETQVSSQNKHHHPDRHSKSSAHLAIAPSPCLLCPETHHPLYKCPRFNQMNVAERLEWVKTQRLCFNCLKHGHSSQQCEKDSCRICHAQHHSMLHLDAPAVSSQPTTTAIHSLWATDSNVLLPTAIGLIRDSHGQFLEVRCMLDSGSQSTVIREDCAQRLGLKQENALVTVLGVGETPQCTAKGAVQAILKSRTDPDFEMTVYALVLPSVTGKQPTVPVKNTDWSHLHQLQLADPAYNMPARVDIILGGDIFNDLLTSGILKGHAGVPTAICTSLGWVLCGPVGTKQPDLTEEGSIVPTPETGTGIDSIAPLPSYLMLK